MARFLDGYKPKKKKKEETVKKVQSPSVSTKAQNRAQQAQQQKTYGGNRQQPVKRAATNNNKTTTQKRQQTTSQQTQRTVDRLQQKYGGTQPGSRNQSRTTTPSRRQRNANANMNLKQSMIQKSQEERQARRASSPTITERQRQKMGLNDMASKETQEAANRAIRNTPGLVKKAVKDTVSGHLQTIADITEMTASNENGTKAKAMKMGIDLNDKKQMTELEQERKRTVQKARLDREKWAAEQDQRQQEWDKKVNGAKGGEKAYYGAVESGTGMLTDLAIGLGTQGGSLAAMFSRTYGTTRGQAQKEGATEAEDRTYSFLQAAKEVGTELMFPGVGLAKGYAKKTGLPLAERVANNLTNRIANRTAADLTGAGVRLLGGTAEENLEEVAGFGLDPLIKEFSYGRNVRTRQKMADLQSESDQLRANIQSEDDARRVASYLSSSEWLDQNKQQYMEAGLNEKDAQEVAEKMRDYMTASLTGDTKTMDVLEQDIASTLSKGEFSYTKSLDKTELLDTLASTTLLTMTTGLPGTATTAMRGSVIRDNLGTDGIRTLAESAMNYEDSEASMRGQVARDRINAGKELTASEVYELAASQAQQVEKDTRRVVAKNNVVADTLESEKLVAPMIMRDDKGNISGDAVITQRYNDSEQEAENALRDLDKEQKLSLSESELAVGSRAIAGFQTGAFTINDANALNYTNTAVREAFEKVTGVDLGQYVVKTSSGAVDYAATNAATKDALFTMATDNFIETARAETENFKDITKGITAEQMAARVGSEGDIAISTALDTVDPADEDTYGLMASAAQNVYEYGRYTEDTWDDVSANLSEMYPGLSQEALQDVYDAAKRDKAIAENPYYNARITAGESTRNMDMSEAEQAEYGKFTNDTGEDIGMKERAVLESIAREFNINIRLLPSEFFEYKYVDRNGKEKTAYSNGSYDPKTGTMLLNGGNDMERNIIAVALHEITHHIAIYAPDEYLALSNRVMETWYKNDADAFSAAIQRKQDNYKAQVKQNLSEEQALEEVIADAMGEMSADPDFISQICTEEPSLAEQIINAIKSVLRKLRAILASGNVAEEHEDAFFNQLGIWDDAQRLWLQAAKVAQQARANQMIDEWDENARQNAPVEETIEETAEDLEPQERFSLNEPVEHVRDLIAIHNLPEWKLKSTLELGGFPMPSIAVTNQDWTDFGDISILFGSDTIDPKKNRDNKVYSADAWTPTVPQTEYESDHMVVSNVYNTVKDLVGDEPYYRHGISGELHYQSIEQGLRNERGLDGYIERLLDKPYMQYAYLKSQGKEITIPQKDVKEEKDWKEARVDKYNELINMYGEDGLMDLIKMPMTDLFEREDVKQFIEDNLIKRKDGISRPGKFAQRLYQDYIVEAVAYSMDADKTIGTKSVNDYSAANKMMDEQIDRDSMKAWLEGLFNGIIKDSGVYNGKDFFTPAGNSRTFKQLHYPATVDGIVRAMREQGEKNVSNYTSTKTLRADTAKSFKSLDEIRSRKDKLKSLTDNEVEAIYKELDDKFYSILNSIGEKSPREYDVFAADYIADVISECAQKNYSKPEQIIKQFAEYNWIASTEDANNILQLFNAIENMPVNMFEAKPRRAVGFNEIKAAIVPDNTDPSIIGALEGYGIPVSTYESSNDEDRINKVNEAAEAQDIRFSLTPEQQQRDDTYMAAINSGNMEEAKRLVGEAAKRAGYNVHVYHGTLSEPFNRFMRPADNQYRYTTGSGFIYATPSEDYAENYAYRGEPFTEDYDEGFVMEGYMNISNLLDVGSVDDEMFSGTDFRNPDFNDEETINGLATNDLKGVAKAVNMTPYELVHYLGEEIYRDSEAVWDLVNRPKFAELIREQGHDGIKLFEWNADAYGVPEPTQIKLADAVTYAEDGSIIPLSERFNPENDDLRYSLSVIDSEENLLSDGQLEYFKNSKAKDRDGRLQVVYHTTNNGGFTIFDPERSNDHRSLFFASNFNVSQTYGENATEPIDLEQAGFKTWESFAKYAEENFADYPGWDASKPIEENLKVEITPAITFDKWLKLSDRNKTYSVEMKIPTATGSEYYMFAKSRAELLRDISTVFGKEFNQKGYYACYLNLENPLIIDGKGQQWNSIVNGGSVIKDGSNVLIKNPSWFRDKATRNDELFGEDHPLEGGNKLRATADELERNNHVRVEIYTGGNGVKEFDVPSDADDVQRVINETFGFEDEDDFGYSIAEELLPELSSSSYTRIDAYDMRAMIDEYGYSTREWAEFAEDAGYDGVIFRDIVDIGEFGYGGMESDVFVAFSSEQVKDIRNTDPTENPDIRYSITDDEEAKSQMAYDDAVDTSYEALSYYETLIDEPEEQIELYAESFSEEKMNDFYAGLNSYSEYFVFDDPVLEEGRKRMARSRNDFMERLNAEWNERWLTDGEILDIRSVRKDVREMVKSIMRNADTPNKVKNDIVNKTLIDIRLAYQFAKKGRIDVADALLWHTSMRMIEGVEFVNDDTFNEYKDLRDYLRTTRIQLGEEYWSDVDYQAFRKNNFGRIKLVKGETNVDEIYQEMCERWPEWFNEEEEMTPPDQLLQIEHVLDVIQPYKEAYSSEEAASIATDIAYDLSDIVYGKGKPYESIADKYKNRYDKQTQAMRQRHEEALRKVREQREKGIKAERAKWQVREQRRKERQAHKKYFDRIVKNYEWLSERLLTNTKDKHIPEQYKKELAELLGAFDLQTVGSKKVEERRGQKGKKTIKMDEINKAIKNIEAKADFFHINDTITDIIDELLGKDADGTYKKELSVEGKTIDELSVDELKNIDNLLKALRHEFTFYETVRTGAKRTQAADIGTAQVDSALKHAELFGPGKDYNNILGAADKILNMDEMTPAYLFKRIDPNNTGLGMMYRELRRSFDKYVKNQEQLNGWMEEILSPYHSGGKMWKKYGAEEIENWRRAKATNTFKLQNGDEIRLTPAQMMSLYCLAKRPQAYQHMVGAGIVIKPVSYQAKLETDLKRKSNGALPTILTDGDIKMICTALTPDQKKVADQLQQLMATKMAAWGNEASRAVIGIDLFGDPDYFPINTDKAAHDEDFTADQFADMIRNFGFTKAVKPGAKNTIAIDDIFTVVSTHCNNMNLYNAYSESMNDFMKVYNFHALRDREDGSGYSDYSVRQVIAHAYSQKATTFISTFMRDLNGNVSKGRVTGIDSMMNAALGNAKKASVFANGRVALQQPTAIVRAFSVISPKYMKGIKIERGAMQEMFEHCPIALWKSWGYYDINMGKSIEDIMMNTGSWAQDKMTDIYGAADNVTWTAIWQMCKSEVKDKNPKVKEGSDEFWDLVNERMTEVVDLTQVVDSPFHRSHAMRDKQILVKMATSFMAEPTLTFNMVRDGLVNSFEMYKLGDKVGAARLLGKTSRVFALSAFATAAAAAIWDAVRGKQPDGDDDDDGTAIGLWWANTLANFQDNLKLWNDIYYIKDIASLFDGWGTSNLALQGWKQLADGYAQLTGAYRVNSRKAWWENMLAGIGYLSGTPYGTILKDGKALLNILGVHPSFLSAIGEQLDSVQDMLGGSSSGSGTGSTSSNNSSNNKKAGSDESDATSAAVRLWTYDNAPIKVEDGSAVDNFLNHFGINMTAAEIAAADARAAQAEYQKKVDKITESLSEYSGEDYDKHLWDKQDLEGYGKALEEGNFDRADEIEKLFLDCGGSQEFLDGKKLYHYNRNYVKSIVYDPTDAQIEQQTRMKDFLLSHGMTEAELSEKVYKSQTTKELKVAFRLNDEDAIVEELTPLIRAGLSYDDFVKAYKYRNRIDLKKYKDGDGKYAERLQSTGVYNWPVTGTITSHFGYRNSPGGIGSTNHKGLDIAASMGTPVGAADGGTVIFAGWDGGFGKCVRVQHDDGTITEYAHLSWWDAKVGDSVAQGQTIGNVGSTGNSTGPHLHFGVKVNGSYVDPLTKLN